MDFHSRDRQPIGRMVVVGQQDPEEYEIIETQGTIAKRGVVDSLRKNLLKYLEGPPTHCSNVVSNNRTVITVSSQDTR